MRKLTELGYRTKTVTGESLHQYRQLTHFPPNNALARSVVLAEADDFATEVAPPPIEFEFHHNLLAAYSAVLKAICKHILHLRSLFYDEKDFPLSGTQAQHVIELVSQLIANNRLPEISTFIAQEHVFSIQQLLSQKQRFEDKINSIVAHHPSMSKITQVHGISPLTAFAFLTKIVDVNRFETSSQLVSFLGLQPNPPKNASFDILSLKTLLCEDALASLESGPYPLHEAARQKIAAGAPPAKIGCVLVRKLAVHL